MMLAVNTAKLSPALYSRRPMPKKRTGSLSLLLLSSSTNSRRIFHPMPVPPYKSSRRLTLLSVPLRRMRLRKRTISSIMLYYPTQRLSRPLKRPPQLPRSQYRRFMETRTFRKLSDKISSSSSFLSASTKALAFTPRKRRSWPGLR